MTRPLLYTLIFGWLTTAAVFAQDRQSLETSPFPAMGSFDSASVAGDSEPLFFDDFDGGSLDSSRWTVVLGGGGIAVSSGFLRIVGSMYHKRLDSLPAFALDGRSLVARARIRLDGAYQKFGFRVNPNEFPGPTAGYYFDTRLFDGQVHHTFLTAIAVSAAGEPVTLLYRRIPVSWYAFHDFAIERTGQEVIFSIDGEEVGRVADAFSGPLPIGFWNDRSGTMTVDWAEVERVGTNPCFEDDFEGGLIDPAWFLDGIGHANQFSAAVVDDAGNGELALTSDGATAYYGRDNGGFLYRALSGDFRIEATVDSTTMDTGKVWRKAGLMARASLDDYDIRLLSMVAPAKERLQFVAREAYGQPGNIKLGLEVEDAPPVVRLAIERTDQTLSVQYSLDGGTTWITPSDGSGGSLEITDLPETLLVGPAVVSNNVSVTSTALFDDISICPTP